jgi:hypothetical protein
MPKSLLRDDMILELNDKDSVEAKLLRKSSIN